MRDLQKVTPEHIREGLSILTHYFVRHVDTFANGEYPQQDTISAKHRVLPSGYIHRFEEGFDMRRVWKHDHILALEHEVGALAHGCHGLCQSIDPPGTTFPLVSRILRWK